MVGSCGTIGVTDGFARVTNEIDWIRENSDNYVRACSARIRPGNIQEGYICISPGPTYVYFIF